MLLISSFKTILLLRPCVSLSWLALPFSRSWSSECFRDENKHVLYGKLIWFVSYRRILSKIFCYMRCIYVLCLVTKEQLHLVIVFELLIPYLENWSNLWIIQRNLCKLYWYLEVCCCMRCTFMVQSTLHFPTSAYFCMVLLQKLNQFGLFAFVISIKVFAKRDFCVQRSYDGENAEWVTRKLETEKRELRGGLQKLWTGSHKFSRILSKY